MLNWPAGGNLSVPVNQVDRWEVGSLVSLFTRWTPVGGCFPWSLVCLGPCSSAGAKYQRMGVDSRLCFVSHAVRGLITFNGSRFGGLTVRPVDWSGTALDDVLPVNLVNTIGGVVLGGRKRQ